MVKLVKKGSWFYVEGADTDVYKILRAKLRAKNPQAYWTNKQRTWPGAELVPEYFELYDAGNKRFPAGLLENVEEALKLKAILYEIKLDGKINIVALTTDAGTGLKDYYWQKDSISAFFADNVAGLGILSLPTRSGKSIVGLRAASMFAKDYPVLYLVNKTEAQKDIIKWWKSSFDTAPVFDEVTDQPGLHVLTYQTAANRDLSSFRFVVGDEIHQSGADTFYDAIMRCENAYHKMGMTGTPTGRGDGKDLFIKAACGPVVYSVERQVIIDHGLCADGAVWFVENPTPVTARGWNELERRGIISSIRNEYLIECAAAAHEKLNNEGQLMAMVQKHSHGALLAKQLGIYFKTEVPYINGRMSKPEREHWYEQIKDGSIKRFVVSNIYNDSVSLPHVRVLINAAGGKSKISTRQRLGRALTGDKEMTLVDSVDLGHKTLKKHSLIRIDSYRSEGYKVLKWRK